MGLIVMYVTDCFTKGHILVMGAYSLDKLDFYRYNTCAAECIDYKHQVESIMASLPCGN